MSIWVLFGELQALDPSFVGKGLYWVWALLIWWPKDKPIGGMWIWQKLWR